MMNTVTLSDIEKGKVWQIMDYIHDQCSMHQWAVGVAEMAAGAAIIATGVQLGHIHIGSDVMGSELDGVGSESLDGAALGGGSAAVAAAILGSIGVVGAGGAIAIPAWLLISGGAAIFGAAGFGFGDAVHHFLHPPIDVGDFFAGASLTSIGVALLIDGARRLIGAVFGLDLRTAMAGLCRRSGWAGNRLRHLAHCPTFRSKCHIERLL